MTLRVMGHFMFLVKDSSSSREERIQKFLSEDPSLSALLAVVHFEWTVRRAIIALGTSPNVVVRAKLRHCHGLDKYKTCWKEEVYPRYAMRLTEVVEDWQGLGRAFSLRHRLVHGSTSCGADYATARVEWSIAATQNIRKFCAEQSIDLDVRLPVRRQSQTAE